MKKYSCDCNIIHEENVYNTKEKIKKLNFLTDVSDFFKILFALDNNEMCVCDIANSLDMSKSSISHQLSTLRKMGIVKTRREGKEVYYMLDDNHVKEVFEVALEHINHKKGKTNEEI